MENTKTGWDGEEGSHYVYHCSDGDHNSFWKTVVESEQWKAWEKSENGRNYDVDECRECGWISQKHFQDFLQFIVAPS